MPKYISATSPVGWYNTDKFQYPSLPPIAAELPAGFVGVSETTWQAHADDALASNWEVVNGIVMHKGAPVTG